MNATVYGERGQMTLPAKARKLTRIAKGDVLRVEPQGLGRILLIRLEKPKTPRPRKIRIIHRGKTHSLIDTGVTVTTEQVKNLLNDIFP